jgi:hypothetical protein
VTENRARWKRFLGNWGPSLVLLFLVAGAFVVLRTPAGPLNTWADLEPHLGTGRPVAVELYSNT